VHWPAIEEPPIAMLTHYLSVMQNHMHLGDPEFAHQIGLDDETWQELRAGHTGYTPAVLARLLIHVPHAHALALDELRHQTTATHLLDSALAHPAVAIPEESAPLAYAA
jgi:hypothetical protein